MPWKPDYITTLELTAYLRIGDSVDDVEAATAVTSSSRAIDKHTNRQFGQLDAATQWIYTARWDYERGVWVVDIDDLQDTAGLVVEVAEVGVIAAADFTLEPVNAVAKGLAYTRLSVKRSSPVQPTGCAHEMLTTAKWGWTAIPVPVKQAAKLQGSRFLSRRDSPYGIAGSPQQGSELRLLARVDPDVGVALTDFVRPRRVG